LLLLGLGCALGRQPDSTAPERSLNVFPIFYTDRNEDRANTVIYPLLFFHHRDGEGAYTAVFPFFRYRRVDAVTDWHLLGGLAAYHHEPNASYRRLNVPFAGWERRPHERGFYIFPLFSFARSKDDPETPNYTQISVLGPMYSHYKKKDYYSLSMVFSFFQTVKGIEQSVNVYKLRLLPLFSYSKNWEPSGVKPGDVRFERKFTILGPLFSEVKDNYRLGYHRVDFLWPFFRFTRGYPKSPREREVTFYALPIVGWAKHWTYDIMGKEERYVNEFHFIDPLIRYRKDTNAGVQLWVIASLFSYSRNLAGEPDFRMLARTVRVAREGDKRIFNIWPLFGTEWDRTLDTRKTIVLGGLFYYRRDADGSIRRRVLWVIPAGGRPATKVVQRLEEPVSEEAPLPEQSETPPRATEEPNPEVEAPILPNEPKQGREAGPAPNGRCAF